MALSRLRYIFIPVLAILLMSHNVYAEQYGSAARYPINSCVSHIVGSSADQYANGLLTNQTCLIVPTAKPGSLPGEVKSLSVAFNSQIPANSFVTLDFTFYDMNTYYGLTPTGAQTKIQEEVTKYTDASHSVFHVTSTFYLSSAVWSLGFNAPVGYVAGDMSIRIHDANVVLLFQPITADQINQLQQKLNSIDANIVIGDDRLTYIYNLLNQQKSEMSQLNDSVQERNNKEYESIDNIDKQSSDDIDSADDSEAQSIVTSLSGIVNQLKDIPNGQNCKINGNLGNIDIGNIDYCKGRDKLPFVVTFFAYVLELGLGILIGIMVYKRIVFMIGYARNG